MELFRITSNKNARHLLLIATFFFIVAGITACSKDEMNAESETAPIGNDDASLLARQMQKIKTKAEAYNVAIVTTKATFDLNYISVQQGDYTVDWGDGIIETNPIAHIYTDGEAAHTIFIYGAFTRLTFGNAEILYIDVSKSPNLSNLNLFNNKLSNIYLSENKKLKSLQLKGNKLHSIDLSSHTELYQVGLSFNPISAIDVSMSPSLITLDIMHTEVASVDVSKNSELNGLMIINTNITSIDVTNNHFLRTLLIGNTLISTVDVSKNPYLEQFSADSLINLTNLDLSNNPKISDLLLSNSGINNIILPSTTDYMQEIDMRGCPIEQNLKKMVSIALALPDRTLPDPDGFVYKGKWRTNSPSLNTIISLLDGTDWEVIQY